MTKNDLEKLVFSAFQSALTQSVGSLPETVERFSDEDGTTELSAIAALCLTESANIATAAVARILSNALPLDD